MPRLPSLLVTATFFGAFVGGAESLVRVLMAADPSATRRAAGIVLTEGLIYSLLGLACGIMLALIWRLVWTRPQLEAGVALDAVTLAALVGALLLFGIDYLFRRLVPAQPIWVPFIVTAMSATAALLVVRSTYVNACRRAERVRSFSRRLGRLRAALCGLGVLIPSGSAVLLPFTGFPGTLAPQVPGGEKEAPRSAVFRPNILIVLLDTLRSDHVSAYGSRREPTPRLDRLAARGTLFQSAYAPSPRTAPSVVSLLTSTYPSEHGVGHPGDHIPEDLPSLPRRLSDHGYTTAAVVGSPLLDRSVGFHRGWDIFDSYSGTVQQSMSTSRIGSVVFRDAIPGLHAADARLYVRLGLTWPRRVRIDTGSYLQGDEVTEIALAALDALGDGPFFLYVHYADPHYPYLRHPLGLVPEATRLDPARREEVVAAYHGEVLFAGDQVGRLLDGLEARGLRESTIVALLSDHGEEFLEHGLWEHGHSLHEEALRIPLILSGPGVPAGVRVEAQVDLLDVAPTLLLLASAPRAPGFRGRSLLPLGGVAARQEEDPPAVPEEPGDPAAEDAVADGQSPPAGPAGHPLYSEVDLPGPSHVRQASVLLDEWKYIRQRDRETGVVRHQLFHRLHDRGELENLADTEPLHLAAMRQVLERVESSLRRPGRRGTP